MSLKLNIESEIKIRNDRAGQDSIECFEAIKSLDFYWRKQKKKGGGAGAKSGNHREDEMKKILTKQLSKPKRTLQEI